MATNPFYQQIEDEARRRFPAILFEWMPQGKLSGSQFEGPDPHNGGSIKVNVATSRWKNFSSAEPGGSNPIGLYSAIKGVDYREAARELAEQFNIERPKPVRLAASMWEPITPIPDFAPNEDGLPLIPNYPGRETSELKGFWCYLSRNGEPLGWRVRIEKADGTKDVMPLTFCRNRETGAMDWRWKDLPSPRPLYGLEWLALEPVARVLIVEGEKTTDAARRLLADGWYVVTWPGGTQRVSGKHTDWSPLLNLPEGARIVLWPDADDPGIKAMAQLAEILQGRCQIVQPDKSWPKGWDLADAEAQGWDTARVLDYLEKHVIEATPAAHIRPAVEISSADLEVQSQAVWTAVNAINDPPWIVATANDLTLIRRDVFARVRRQPANIENLRKALTSRLEFKKHSAEGFLVGAKPSEVLLTNLIVDPKPPIVFMRRLAEVPVLAPDGRLVFKEGYDRESAILYLPHPDIVSLEIGPDSPEESEIEGAVALLDDLLADFPFVADCDRAHAVAFALVPIVRLAIAGRTPLFRFEAPQPGTGKSLLMRILARLTCSTVSELAPTEDDEEWRKRITSALAREPEAFLIDNANSLKSPSLAKLLTDDTWDDRILGTNTSVRFDVQCVFGATLNNPEVTREILRRSLRIRLDAKTEHPESRANFRHPNLEEYCRENRAALVGALVTIARAVVIPTTAGAMLGGYEPFCRLMAAKLKRAGIEGFLGDRGDTSALSIQENANVAFVTAWGETYGIQKVSMGDLIPLAKEVDGFELGKSETERGQRIALGKWLSSHRGYMIGDWQVGDPIPGRFLHYRLLAFGRSEQMSETPDGGQNDPQSSF